MYQFWEPEVACMANLRISYKGSGRNPDHQGIGSKNLVGFLPMEYILVV